MNDKIDCSDLINLTQASKYLDVSYMTIHRWVKLGKIQVTRIGDMPFVSLAELIKIKEAVND